MKRKVYGVLGLLVVAAVALTVVRIVRFEREARVPVWRKPLNFIEHSDPRFEVQVGAFPAFVPAPFVAPTTAPTRPAGEGWSLPVGTRIVLRDDHDRRIIVA